MPTHKSITQPNLAQLKQRLGSLANADQAELAQRFFKTGAGQYGEGDLFLGIRVPETRKLLKEFSALALKEVTPFIKSKWHEERLLGLLFLVQKYKKGNDEERAKIFQIYVDHFPYVNNWDLVDVTAEHVTGAHLYLKPESTLCQWAKSSNLWVRRIAMLSTFYNIRKNEFQKSLEIAAILLHDEQDLIHKAVGWLLREIGKRDLLAEETFLKAHQHEMPRTMLRYAIERFPEKKRQAYLKGDF